MQRSLKNIGVNIIHYLKDYYQQKIASLDVMQNQIQQHEGLLLFKFITSEMKAFSTQKIEQQENLMQCLQVWWDHNKLVASYLMARLLPDAEKVIDNHRLCDAIGLYLSSGDNPELRNAMEILLAEPGVRKRYRKIYQHFLSQQ